VTAATFKTTPTLEASKANQIVKCRPADSSTPLPAGSAGPTALGDRYCPRFYLAIGAIGGSVNQQYDHGKCEPAVAWLWFAIGTRHSKDGNAAGTIISGEQHTSTAPPHYEEYLWLGQMHPEIREPRLLTHAIHLAQGAANIRVTINSGTPNR